MNTSLLTMSGVSKSYANGAQRLDVLRDVNLAVEPGEFVAIVGFSGSGKTTLVSLLAGLQLPDAGEIQMRGKPVTQPGPERGVVFQNYSLLPWLTVLQNVELAVDQIYPEWVRERRRRHAEIYIRMVGLEAAKEKRPAQLSGGMRQRVSVARALAANPEVLLMDEPLSALDALTRANLQDEFETIWRQEKTTMVLITNHVDEAILLADRIIPLTPGPGATLGPSFAVDIPRPRNRHALNHDKAFQDLRQRITGYLLSQHRAGATGSKTGKMTRRLPPSLGVPVGRAGKVLVTS